MNKSILLIALCVLISTIAVVHGADVEVKFVNDYLVRKGYNPIEIKFTNKVALASGVTFTAQVSKVDNEKTPPFVPNKVYNFDVSNNIPYPASVQEGPLIGVLDNSKCVDTTTKQIVGTLKFTSATKFSFAYDQGTNFITKYKTEGPFADITVHCLVPLDTTVKVDYFNINISYSNGATPGPDPIDQDLVWPAKGYITPRIEFKSLSYGADLARPEATSSVDFQWATDTIGVYRVAGVNSPRFADRNHQTGDLMDLWCSNGSNKKAARVEYGANQVLIFVLEVPAAKSSLSCKLFFDTATLGDFVRSKRSSITIAYADVLVARTLDFAFTPGVIGTAPLTSAGQSTTVQVQANSLAYSSTPVNVNSTIEFKFSKHFGAGQLILPTTQQEYRKFTGCSLTGATIFVDAGANTITLKDVQVADYNSFTCTFQFNGSDTFGYDSQSKMGSVAVSIDGKSLVSGVSNGNTHPIYLRSQFVVTPITHEQTLNAETYTIVDTFSIKDNYHDRHVTPTEPLLLLSLGDVNTQYFSHDDHAKQITCLLSTPTDSKAVEVKLAFDIASLSWSAPLKDVINLETFDLALQCTQTRAKVMKNGLEITLQPTLTVQVVDLIDGKRFQQTFEHYAADTTPASPTAPPSGWTAPAKAVWYGHFSSQMTLKTTANNDDRKAVSDYFTKTVTEFLTTAKSSPDATDPMYKDFKLATTPSAFGFSWVSDTNYFNTTGAELRHNFVHKIAEQPYLPFGVTVPSTNTRAQTSAQSYASDIALLDASVRGWFTMTPPTDQTDTWTGQNSFAASYAIWDADLTKVVTTDFIYKASPLADTDAAHKASAITACGYVEGTTFSLKSGVVDTDFKWETTSTNGPNYKVNDVIHQCSLGEACTVNADCASNPEVITVCKSQKCTAIPKTLPKYVQIVESLAPTEKPYDIKQYFNSSSTVSAVVAFVAIVAALLF